MPSVLIAVWCRKCGHEASSGVSSGIEGSTWWIRVEQDCPKCDWEAVNEYSGSIPPFVAEKRGEKWD